jgi:ATP-binding cassette subfamily B protein/subfamily B ATP-binding cassette protein MsbA
MGRTLRQYSRLSVYVLRQGKSLALIAVCSVLAAALAAAQPWPTKILVDFALGDEAAPRYAIQMSAVFGLELTPLVMVWASVGATLAIFVVGAFIGLGNALAWGAASQRMVYDLSKDLFRRLQQQSLSDRAQRAVGDSLNRLTSDTWSVYTLTHALIVVPALHLFTIVVIGVIAWRLDPILALIAVSAVPIVTVSAYFFAQWLKEIARSDIETTSAIMRLVQQTIAGIAAVQAFDASEANRGRFEGLAQKAVGIAGRRVLFNQAASFVSNFSFATVTAGVLWIGATRVLAGHLTLGSLLVFLAYLGSIQGAVKALLTTYVKLRMADASIDRIFEVMDNNNLITDEPNAVPYNRGDHAEKGHLEFRGVVFSYADGSQVLNGIDLIIQPGEKLAIVGPSGAGKSTLAGLVPRLFDPTQGQVLIDGQDLRGLSVSSLRAEISIVLQDSLLLPMTVAENIAYGRPEATREDVIAAAVNAGAHNFIRELPNGYDSILGERGATLSGGQRQRISIARALLKDAAILVLDEPTSALDVATERDLLAALDRLMENRTTIIIAHRLSTIKQADRIVVLKDGAIVEQGSHKELIKRGGAYRQMYAFQDAGNAQAEVV